MSAFNTRSVPLFAFNTRSVVVVGLGMLVLAQQPVIERIVACDETETCLSGCNSDGRLSAGPTVAKDEAVSDEAVSDDRGSDVAEQAPLAGVRVSLPEAQRQARLVHTVIHATLQNVHHEYYREDENLTLPAALMKDVFAEIEHEQHVQLRWLAVEGVAMNQDHTPRDQFERDAVRALKAGEKSFELTEDGVFRRAGPIRLSGDCLKCHVPDRKSTRDRTAGLIISIPVNAAVTAE